MTNPTTNAPPSPGRAAGSKMAPALRADHPGFVDEEALTFDGLVIDIEQLGAFEDVGRRAATKAE